MESLALAIKIADLADEALEAARKVDVPSEARRLVKEHPEAEMTEKQVASAIRQEQEAEPID